MVLIAGATLVWGLDRTPHLTVGGPPGPVRPAPVGTWVFTHTVELPAGGVLAEREVMARSSRSRVVVRESVFRPHAGGFVDCQVEVWPPGESVRRPARTTPVRVGRAQASFAPYAGEDRPFGLFWTGPNGQTANVACLDQVDPAVPTAVASWVRFGTTPVATPVRLTSLPPGYRADRILFRESDPPLLIFVPPDEPINLPQLAAYVHAGTDPAPGQEQVIVNGRPAAMHAYYRLLCFTDRPVCVGEYATDPMGNGQTWPTGVREMLIDTAAGLVAAPDVDDPSTWFPGREAFPG